MAIAPSPVVEVRHTIAGEIVLPFLERDAEALERALAAERAQPADLAHAYLDLPIDKPWGWEEKIYDGPLTEAWYLALAAGQATSTHAHIRKTTLLICVEGEGVLTAGDNTEHALAPGSVARIEPGAVHTSSTTVGMSLLELEIPPGKLDVLRLDDRSGRAGTGYEGPAAALTAVVAGRDPVPLAPVSGGPPRTRLRGRSSDGRFAFDLRSGALLRARPAGLRAAISLATWPLLSGEFTVLSRDTAGRAFREHTFLTISAAGG